MLDLHLSDEMIDILRSGKINNQLLCEIVTHEDFCRLLADIEIYVDRIASVPINNLNTWVSVARAEILARQKPDEKDLYFRTLEAAYIQEDKYFTSAVHEDIDAILADIREAHKKDITTADDGTVATKLKQDIEDAMRFKGSDQERQTTDDTGQAEEVIGGTQTMRNEAKCISTATLLNERYRRELYNKMTIRPMANDNDVIWQQMPLEYFASLLEGKQLFLRAYGEYVSYDEKRLIEFVKPHVAPIDDECKRSVIQSEMEKEYSEFEKKLFISCWFNSKNLSDVVFKVYAKGNSGIAIGTTVGILKEQLDNVLTKDAEIQNIVCGNVQYIPQTLLSTEQMFEPAQIYAPVFLKGVQFQMDTEFRVCVELKNPQELIYNKCEKRQIQSRRLSASADQLKSMVSTSKEDCKISAELFQQMEQYLSEYDGKQLTAGCAKKFLDIEPSQLIQNIAVKEDGIWKKFSDAEIESFFITYSKCGLSARQKRNIREAVL